MPQYLNGPGVRNGFGSDEADHIPMDGTRQGAASEAPEADVCSLTQGSFVDASECELEFLDQVPDHDDLTSAGDLTDENEGVGGVTEPPAIDRSSLCAASFVSDTSLPEGQLSLLPHLSDPSTPQGLSEDETGEDMYSLNASRSTSKHQDSALPASTANDSVQDHPLAIPSACVTKLTQTMLVETRNDESDATQLLQGKTGECMAVETESTTMDASAEACRPHVSKHHTSEDASSMLSDAQLQQSPVKNIENSDADKNGSGVPKAGAGKHADEESPGAMSGEKSYVSQTGSEIEAGTKDRSLRPRELDVAMPQSESEKFDSKYIRHPSLDMNDIAMWADWKQHALHGAWIADGLQEDWKKFVSSWSRSVAQTIDRTSTTGEKDVPSTVLTRRPEPSAEEHARSKDHSQSFDGKNIVRKSSTAALTAVNSLLPCFKKEDRAFSMTMSELIPQTNDMGIEDLYEDKAQRLDPSTRADSLEVKRDDEANTTELHEICRKGTLEQLIQRLKLSFVSQRRKFPDGLSYTINYMPGEEVTTCNEVGQLPLHLAAMNRSTVQEIDGLKSEMQHISQPAPGLVAVLVTGRNPQNGEQLFVPRRDGANRSMDCIHQDNLGLTPLHLAAMSDSVAAYAVACSLVEANPLAAKIGDMDGFLPLDLACRNPARGSASIVKMLLRVYPQAAIVDDSNSTGSDWSLIADKLNPFLAEANQSLSFQRSGRALLDMELSNVVDGVLFDSFEEKTHGFVKKDMTYLLPQRVCAQQLLLELSSFYRPGNISEPGPMYPIERKDLLQKLANDNMKKRIQYVKPDGIKVIHAKAAGGLRSAIEKSKEEREKRDKVRKMQFKGTWKGISERIFAAEETPVIKAPSSTESPNVHLSTSPNSFQSSSPTPIHQKSSSPVTVSSTAGTMNVVNTRRGLVRSNSILGREATNAPKSPQVSNSFTSMASKAFGSPTYKADGEDGGGKSQSPSLKKAVSTQSSSLSNRRNLRKVATALEMDMNKKSVEEWMTEMGLEREDEIYSSTLPNALARKDLTCLEWMGAELLKEADVTNKGHLTFEEMREWILKVTRMNHMAKGIRLRWRSDPEYVQVSPNIWTNSETDRDVDRTMFTNCVENARLDNSSTQRRRDKPIQHTWSGLPIYDEEDLERVRPRVIRARNLIENIQRQHKEVGYRRLPLHFCCANNLNPEAAVMMRDVLSAYEHAARIKDDHGRLPLHVACMNESYMSGTMVRLLLSKYKDACMEMDDDGYIPLHLCLLHNHGDAALEIVTMLLHACPRSARLVCGHKLLKGELTQPEFAVHFALSNKSIFADKILTCLIDAYPEALVQRGCGGETLLHYFCWIQHQCPIEAQYELETNRGITGRLRAPELQQTTHHLWDDVIHVFHQESNFEPEFPARYNAAAKLQAILNSAKRYFPHSLDLTDVHGALPIHYVCQVGGPCSREILDALLQMHPHSFNVQDCNGNSPLHLAIGSGKVDLAKILAHFASSRQWSSKLSVPNDRKQLPSQVPGAWKVRALFKIDTFFDTANTWFQSIFVPALTGLSIYVASLYYSELHDTVYCFIMIAPFVCISLINIGLDLVEMGITRDTAKIVRMLQKSVLQCCQLRTSVSLLRSTILGQAPSRRALLTRRMEMPLMAFPLAIFNLYRLICECAQPRPPQDNGDCEAHVALHLSLVVCFWMILALSATEQDSHRYWSIPHMPMLRHAELGVTFLYRMAESMVRVVNLSLFAAYIGPGYCFLFCVLEIVVMIMLAGQLLSVIADPACFQSLEILASEFFDLCGTFHPFHLGMEEEVVLGQCGHRDTMVKSFAKICAQVTILIANCFSLGESWAPFKNEGIAHASHFVFVVLFGMFSQFVILGVHYSLIELRRRYLKDVRSLALLQSWSFPLFDKLSPEFLQDAQNVLQMQEYNPGDYIVRQGECRSTMYLLVNGMIIMPREKVKSSRWKMGKNLLRTTSKLASRPFRKKTSSSSGKLVIDTADTSELEDFLQNQLDNSFTRKRAKSGSPISPKVKEKAGDISSRRDSNKSQNLSTGFSDKSSEASEVHLGFHGAFFGAEGLFFGSPSTKDVIARTKCTARFLNRESMAQLLIKHPQMVSALLKNAKAMGLKLSKQDVNSLITNQEEREQSKPVTPDIKSRWRAATGANLAGSLRSTRATLVMDSTWRELISHLSITQEETNSLTITDIMDCITWELSCLLNISGSSISIAIDFNAGQNLALSIAVDRDRDPDLIGVASSDLLSLLQELVEEQGEEIRSHHFLCKVVRVQDIK